MTHPISNQDYSTFTDEFNCFDFFLLTAQDSSLSTYSKKDKDLWWFTNGNSGNFNTSISNTEISSSTSDPLKLKLDAGNLIYAEYDPQKSTTANLNYLSALDPAKAIYNPLSESGLNILYLISIPL